MCDTTELTYSHIKGVLVFNVTYKLRATDSRKTDVWMLSCRYDLVYRFEGTPPTQDDTDAMQKSVLTLAHNSLRETVHYMTGLCGMPPLVIELARFPEPK